MYTKPLLENNCKQCNTINGIKCRKEMDITKMVILPAPNLVTETPDPVI
jgi:hypothetical protein